MTLFISRSEVRSPVPYRYVLMDRYYGPSTRLTLNRFGHTFTSVQKKGRGTGKDDGRNTTLSLDLDFKDSRVLWSERGVEMGTP